MIFQMISLTVLGQNCLIHDEDCVHITRNQQRQCLKWSKEIDLKDSIIVSKDSIISIQSVFITSSDVRIKKIDQDLSESQQSLHRMKKKRKNAFIIGGISCILSALLTLIVTI